MKNSIVNAKIREMIRDLEYGSGKYVQLRCNAGEDNGEIAMGDCFDVRYFPFDSRKELEGLLSDIDLFISGKDTG